MLDRAANPSPVRKPRRCTVRYALAIAAAALLPSCGGGQGGLAPATRSASWAASSASNGALLYISDAYRNKVFVYSFPALALVGTLTGFSQPEGECVDGAGDVWIADYGKSQVIEYAHGSSEPIATLSDPNNFPYACAVDPVSGDLAVVNFGENPNPGGLSIYKKAKGSPHLYTDDSLSLPFFAAYDAQGNLFVDGIRGFYYPDFALVRFSKGTFTNIALDHTITAPGGIVVVGSRINIGDAWRDAHAVYGFAVKGLKGRLIGKTRLRRATVVEEFDVSGKSLVAANIDQLVGSGMIFKYPDGGSPRQVFGKGTLEAPIGLVISP